MDQDRRDELPLLREPAASLPAAWYRDPAHHAQEMRAIWQTSWIYICRSADIGRRSYRTSGIGDQTVLLVRDEEGHLHAFHNTCRHRGAELCPLGSGTLTSKLLVCRYHQWSYSLDGRLARVPHGQLPVGFDMNEHGLLAVAVTEWRGFVFVNLSSRPGPFDETFDQPLNLFANWPLERLQVGHRSVRHLACNWKIFWENYNECLHCPGVHPLLCDLVPIYGRAIMGTFDDAERDAHAASPDPRHRGGLKPGARTWSLSGKTCPPGFQGLTPAEQAAGHTFFTGLPSCFIVAHVDYVRIVSMRPLGPAETELTAEWLFLPETLSNPAFDLHDIVDFGTTVMAEDAAVCEINQRGLAASGFAHGTLMPEEYELLRFHNWVRDRMATEDTKETTR